MTPSDQSILKTVQLLVMLHRANKNDHTKKTDGEKDDLFVKKEYVIVVVTFLGICYTTSLYGTTHHTP